MPVPTQYSESLFRDYLVGVLDQVGVVLGWDAGSPAVVEALNDALLDYGISDIANATNMRELRALGRRAIWRAVVEAVSGKYDIRGPDATFPQSQIQKQALEALKLAESDCLPFDPNYTATVLRVSRPQDPYIVLEDAQRVP